MEVFLYFELSKDVLQDGLTATSAYSWGKWTQDTTVHVALRLCQRIRGSSAEVNRVFHSLKATLGKQSTPAQGGEYRLKIGDPIAPSVPGTNLSAPIPWNATHHQIVSALNALSAKPAIIQGCTTEVDKSVMLWRQDGGELTLSIVDNHLWPVSFVRILASSASPRWVYELRTEQAPLAMTSYGARELPEMPRVTRSQSGGEFPPAILNEIQNLYIPPQFRGVYVFRLDGRTSLSVSMGADAEEIQDALSPLCQEPGDITCLNTDDAYIQIQFGGSMAGTSYALLEVEVIQNPPGDIHFTLPLNSWELSRFLAGAKKGDKVPFEISLVLEDVKDANKLHTHVARTEVEILPRVGHGMLSVPQNVDFLRRPSLRTYVPVTEDQIWTGQPGAMLTFGDGASTEFTFDHPLETQVIIETVRENIDGGALLVRGTHYTVTMEGEDSFTVTMLGDPPGENALVLMFMSALPLASFGPHTHTIAQVLLLQEKLDALHLRLQVLEELVPSGALALTLPQERSRLTPWTLPSIWMVIPGCCIAKEIAPPKSLADLTADSIPSNGGLLPAVHDVAAEPLVLPLPTVPSDALEGKVYQYSPEATQPLLLPGGHDLPAVEILPGAYIACVSESSRLSWYEVRKIDATKSTWYPVAMERELFLITVTPDQLPLERRLEAHLGLALATVHANTPVQCELVFEHGTISAKSTPGTPDQNLDDYVWDPTPLLSCSLTLTAIPVVVNAGVRIARALVGLTDTITSAAIIYGRATASPSAPASASFVLRARLRRFDTADSQHDPLGRVLVLGPGQKASDDSDLAGEIFIESLTS